jgi:hypothetical protein
MGKTCGIVFSYLRILTLDVRTNVITLVILLM